MSRPISSVLDIKPGGSKRWTVLVQVVENAHVQQSRSGHEFKRLVLTDSEGTTLNALIFSNHLRYFARLLVQYKRYFISNANLTKNDPRYRISAYEYSWILNNRTLIEEHTESIPMTLPCRFEFTAFSGLHKYADSEYLQNVRAVVLHCFPSQEQGSPIITRRDLVIVNEEKKLLLLTLWNEFDEKEGNMLSNLIESGPLIFGMRLKVTTFNSLSLTTRASSGLLINPPTTDDLQMKDWYNDNKDELQQLLAAKSYKNSDMLLPYPKEEDIVTVSTAVSSLNTMKTAWIKGKTSLPTQERSLWYIGCANCQKFLDADLSWVVTCTSCKQLVGIEPVSRITIVIDDGTASIHATICTPDAEKLMPFTALQLKEAEEFGIDLLADIAASVQQHTIVAFIRSFETTFNGQTQLKLSVVKAHTSTIPTTTQVSEPKPDAATKDVVTEVSKDKGKNHVYNPSTLSKPIKRSLAVSEANPHQGTITTDKAHGTLLAVKKEVGVAAQATHESPTKKTK